MQRIAALTDESTCLADVLLSILKGSVADSTTAYTNVFKPNTFKTPMLSGLCSPHHPTVLRHVPACTLLRIEASSQHTKVLFGTVTAACGHMWVTGFLAIPGYVEIGLCICMRRGVPPCVPRGGNAMAYEYIMCVLIVHVAGYCEAIQAMGGLRHPKWAHLLFRLANANLFIKVSLPCVYTCG